MVHVLGKKVAIFDWEWGRNSALREGQKMPCLVMLNLDLSFFVNIIDPDQLASHEAI